MRKRTEPQTPKHRKLSRAGAEDVGLIATGENTPQSDRHECALVNRSHRTHKLTGAGPTGCPDAAQDHTLAPHPTENMNGPASACSDGLGPAQKPPPTRR